MKIQYISDIHLEHRKDYYVNPVAPNLALCGDIGHPLKENYNYFINRCANDFKNVFIIFGNHEFYTKTSDKYTMDEIINLAKFPKNVYFLNNNSLYLNTYDDSVKLLPPKDIQNYIKIIGSTLWSNIDPNITKYVNDYKKIWVEHDRKMNYIDTLKLFNTNVSYILKELSCESNIDTVLLTHHGTHPICNGKYENKINKLGIDVSSAYVSFIERLYTFKNLIVCISGHTHSSINKYLYINNHKILFLSNQVGYKGEDKMILNYNPKAVWSYFSKSNIITFKKSNIKTWLGFGEGHACK
jgi:predicted phosphodiesterase